LLVHRSELLGRPSDWQNHPAETMDE
jgi:hypothetical protein